jgi:endonuclease G
MITTNFIDEGTEQRFVERTSERERKIGLIDAKQIVEANPAELVKKRAARLKADPDVLQAINEGMKARRPSEGFSAAEFPRALERVLQTNDLMSIGFFERGLQVARPVARISTSTGNGYFYGTGFLVSPRLMLTNHHVFGSEDEAGRSVAEFNYKRLPDGSFTKAFPFRFAPEDFFLTDKELDYTLVALRDGPELEQFGWLRLIQETGKLMVGEKVNIIQHPNGEPQQIAVRENQVVDELELFIHYKTDTAPGSSGSPVFNDQWEVVALHHSGVPARDGQGRVLATDGRVWDESMGEQRINWVANEGARVSRLLAHIKDRPLADSSQRRLRAEMLEKEPPNGSTVFEPNGDKTRHLQSEKSGASEPFPQTCS